MKRDTLIPIGLVAAIVIMTASSVLWQANKFGAIDLQILELRKDLKVVQEQAGEIRTELKVVGMSELKRRIESLEKRAADRWRGADMKAWASLLGTLNANLKVPDVLCQTDR